VQDSTVTRLSVRPPLGRYLVLIGIALLAASTLAMMNVEPTSETRTARWPVPNDMYVVSGWSVAPATNESAWGITHVSRGYRRSDGVRATLTISTSTEAKGLYKSGADLPYLGNGFTAEPVSSDIVTPRPGREAELLRRNAETWLLFYSFGERRGLIDGDLQRWALVGFDAMLGHPNDYYLLRVAVPVSGADVRTGAQAGAALVDVLFPRLAGWYAAQQT
jgi:hypothetical protein